jgi:hypothetical protein
MDGLIAQIQRIWPKADWSIACHEGEYIARIVENATLGLGTSRQSPEVALAQALSAALHTDYERQKRPSDVV